MIILAIAVLVVMAVVAPVLGLAWSLATGLLGLFVGLLTLLPLTWLLAIPAACVVAYNGRIVTKRYAPMLKRGKDA